MSLEIQKLYFSYPSSHVTLFEDFSLQFNDGWTCIAGSNGCGKSTLLKLIAGLLKPDEGRIVRGGQSTTGCVIYCPQETAEVPENIYSVFWSDDNEVRRFFSMLHITEEMIARYDSLSGGEKKRIQIACALAEQPAVLLLDEPTNHLDEGTVRMISDTLALFDGIGIIVSHDRSFADSLCKHTVYLYNEARAFSGGRECVVCESYSGGLSKALELREQKASHNRGEWERLNSKAAGEKQRSRRLAEENERSKSRLAKKNIDPRDHDAKRKIDVARLGGKDRSTGDAKANLDSQIQRTEAARDSVKKSLMRKEGFSVEGAGFAKAIVIEESDIFASEEKTSYKLHIPRIVINPDSKIALTGQNGTGKSLFIKHLISELEKSGRTKEVMYLPQEIPEVLKNQILSDFNELEDAERGAVLSTLYRLGSEPDNLQQGSVSPGELRKLMISLVVEKPLSLLILDEPTNHMDITSVLALENALSSLSCALIVVSHDRAFLEKVTDVKLHAERIENEGRIFYDL
ncbi:ATP-binding cassette domain-containing protein [Treponema bryantii]|uniref:ATP-binding cassette domain-containing protein n=1 Tax=Treponema bryantii TaxID=163 RepID=UPI0003B49E21|nr:ATP-binding cassette domain-containing protein [Treponema bryantii]